MVCNASEIILFFHRMKRITEQVRNDDAIKYKCPSQNIIIAQAAKSVPSLN